MKTWFIISSLYHSKMFEKNQNSKNQFLKTRYFSRACSGHMESASTKSISINDQSEMGLSSKSHGVQIDTSQKNFIVMHFGHHNTII